MIIQADSKMIPLAPNSVNCIVTSPPYWGLRDYGTAQWLGGDSDCPHIKSEIRTTQGLFEAGKKYRGGGIKHKDVGKIQYSEFCPECGALSIDNQVGKEPTPQSYVDSMVAIFRQLRRVLKDDGTAWLNLGDSYSSGFSGQSGQNESSTMNNPNKGAILSGRRQPFKGMPPKNLVGMPWRVAIALQDDGWYLRSDIIWSKPNPMPESVTDRPTKSHEYIFLLSKSARYYYDANVIREPYAESSIQRINQVSFEAQTGGPKDYANGINPNRSARKTLENFRKSKNKGRNKRTVWEVAARPYSGAHFAVFPPDLIEPCILAGCPPGGIVLDPFFGSGTVGEVAKRNGRGAIGLELNPEYIGLAQDRINRAMSPLPGLELSTNSNNGAYQLGF